jgi:hypothetical protein
MTARCCCGVLFWTEEALSCCPRCAEWVLVRRVGEPKDAFEEREAGYPRTRAQIRALPEVPESCRRRLKTDPPPPVES